MGFTGNMLAELFVFVVSINHSLKKGCDVIYFLTLVLEFEENKEESVADTIQKLQILFPQHDKEYLNTVFSGSIHINEAVEKILKEMNNLVSHFLKGL